MKTSDRTTAAVALFLGAAASLWLLDCGDDTAAQADAGADSSVDALTVDTDSSADAPVDAGACGVTVYPPMPGGEFRSDRYSVVVTGAGAGCQSLPSYVYESQNHDNGVEPPKMAANHWTSFELTGPTTVTVTLPAPATAAVIRPRAKGVTATTSGNAVSFTLTTPGQYYVDLTSADGGYSRDPLFIFASAPEVEAKPVCGPDDTCFGPGYYASDGGADAGETIWVKAGHVVYIAGGAYVKGHIALSDPGASPGLVKVRGRGILSGIDYAHQVVDGGCWSPNPHMIDGRGAPTHHVALDVEGLTITDGPGPTIESFGTDTVDNVKLMGWHTCTDGFTSGPNGVLRNSFIKVQDDAVLLSQDNITVENVVAWHQTSGAVLQMSWNNTSDVTRATVTGVDVIGDDLATSSVPAPNGGVFSCQNFNGHADGTPTLYGTPDAGSDGGVWFRSVRVEVPTLELFSIHTRATTKPGYTQGRGSIEGITFKDLTAVSPRVAGTFEGAGPGDGGVQDGSVGEIAHVTFDNVVIGDAGLATADAALYVHRMGLTRDFTYR